MRRHWPKARRPMRRWLVAGLTLMASSALVTGMASSAGAQAAGSTTPRAASGAAGSAGAGTCSLGPTGAVKHVIYLQFDNTHFTRDTPSVPSDIQQMPNLAHFMERNGTVIARDHTPLIAHSADDFLTSLTGVYPNRHGMPEANEYKYYKPDGTTDEAGSFAYWTDPVDSYTTKSGLSASDHTPNLVDAKGKMAPAPWVPYTRAGCNVGDVAMANTELENTEPDIPDVFGAHSAPAKEALAQPSLAATDFEGLSVHCAKRNATCSADPHAVADRLPAEPGGYHGFRAVFGAKYLDGTLNHGPVTNLDGKVITDSSGHAGFPGYDAMQATNALSYTLDMQEHGVPVTYTYLSDVHDNATTGNGMGPGQATYESQLRSYNRAFGQFFRRLRAHGITKANTLFIFGEDEGDHYVGSKPTNPGCNGVTTPCRYSQLGEVGLNVQGLLAAKQGIRTPFSVQADSAPFVYLNGQPARTAPAVRRIETALGRVKAEDPYRKRAVDLTHYLADPVEMRLLHMVTSDPARTPTLTLFANPDFYLSADGTTCKPASCESYQTDVWNHGDVARKINTTWLGLVGPGVRHLGVDRATWASETDTRPTMMSLLGLRDDYAHEGRVLVPVLRASALPGALRGRAGRAYDGLARAYTTIESPVGRFGLATLRMSTTGLESTNASVYRHMEARIAAIGRTRNRIGAQMIRRLEAASFAGRPVAGGVARSLEARAARLVHRVEPA